MSLDAAVPAAAIGPDPALLVVDMQNGFLDERGSFAGMGIDVASLRRAVAGCALLVGAARQAEVPVIFTRFAYQAGYVDAGVTSRELFPGIRLHGGLAEGSWDAAIIDQLAPQPGDVVIDKSRYSAFYGTRLLPVLTALRVRTIIVCGITTNMCVESTVRDGAQRDYRMFVVEDATAELAPERHRYALEAISYGFGWVVDRDWVETEWGARAKQTEGEVAPAS